MHTGIIITTVSFVFTGLLFIGLAVPLIKRRIPPNELYGFRMKAAFSSPEVWYDVNEYSGRLMRNVGALILVSVPILLFSGVDESIYALSMTAVILLGTVFMTIRSILYLQKLTRQ